MSEIKFSRRTIINISGLGVFFGIGLAFVPRFFISSSRNLAYLLGLFVGMVLVTIIHSNWFEYYFFPKLLSFEDREKLKDVLE